MNSPILPTAGLASENQRMMSLIVGLSLLKTHFGEAMQPTKPYAMISESFSVTTEITLNCRLSELKSSYTITAMTCLFISMTDLILPVTKNNELRLSLR